MKKEENKFLVIKREWLESSLNDTEFEIFQRLIDKAAEGKPNHSYYVVNLDEPYAEQVWGIIEKNEEKKEVKRRHVKVQYPVLDKTESVSHTCMEKTVIDYTWDPNGNEEKGNYITVDDAFSHAANSFYLLITNNGSSTSTLTIKAGGAYPNSMLGDLEVEIPVGTSAIQIQDFSRFEKRDDSMDLDFAKDFIGYMYVVAKCPYVQ